MINTKEIISHWQAYLTHEPQWTKLINEVTPKTTGCGLIYELPNPMQRPQESFAIADMRHIRFAQPHYHLELEIYFVLQGEGVVVIGEKLSPIQKDSVVIIPSSIAHFTIPKRDLVLAVVNTPPQQNENYIPLHESNQKVKFDKKQFDSLIKQYSV